MPLDANMLVIDDSNYHRFVPDSLDRVDGQQAFRGRVPRDFTRHPLGGLAGVSKLPIPLIPRGEWSERIKERRERKQRMVDLIDFHGSKCKNQQQTNYCWINAPTRCVELIRHREGQKHVELSPASAGAQIKRYQNVGGWGNEGLEWIIKHGLVPVEQWPANAIDSRYATPENLKRAMDFRVTEWWELTPRSFDELATVSLLGWPTATGHNWWGHEVTLLDLEEDEPGSFGLIGENSWGENWPEQGKKGRFFLRESKATPDDAVVPRSTVVTG